jgi:hypothetical protein
VKGFPNRWGTNAEIQEEADKLILYGGLRELHRESGR